MSKTIKRFWEILIHVESTPAGPESNIQRGGKIAVEHRSRYALATWFLEEIVNLSEIKKIAEDIEKISVHPYCHNQTK